MSDIFISYSRKDSDFVKTVHAALAERGRRIWVDWEGIPLSANWWREICDGIESADTFVFVMSPDSVASPICNFEIFHAASYNKRIIPIVYRPVDETSTFAKLAAEKLNEGAQEILGQRDLIAVARESWGALARHNWHMFNDSGENFEANVDKLLDILDTDLDHIKMHTRLLLRALQWEQAHHEASRLLRGTEIEEAEVWQQDAAGKDPVPSTLHVSYILASRQRQRIQNRWLLIVVSLAALMTTSLAVIANNQRLMATDNAATATVAQGAAELNATKAILAQAEAEANAATSEANSATAVYERNRADESARIAQSSFAALQSSNEIERGNLALGLLVAVHALKIADTSYARSALLTVLQQYPQLEKVVTVQTAGIRTVAYSPSLQKPAFATGDDEGKIQLWDGETGMSLGEPLHQTGYVNTMAFTSDGSMLITGGDDGIHRWDVETGMEIGAAFGSYSDESVYDLSLSDDDQFMVVGYENSAAAAAGKARVFRLRDTQMIAELEGHANAVYAVDFRPDGHMVATGGNDNQINLWSFVAGTDIEWITTLTGHRNWILDLEFDPDHDWLYSASADGSLRVWDTRSGENIDIFQEHGNWVRDVAIAHSGHIATASGDSTIIPRESDGTPDRALSILRGHVNEVWEVAFSPDGSQLVSGGEDGQVLLWTMAPSMTLSTLLGARLQNGQDAVFSRDGKRIYAAVGSEIQIWDPAIRRITGEPIVTNSEITTLDDATGLLAAGTAAGDIKVVDSTTGKTRWEVNLHHSVVRVVRFSADGTQLASSDDTGQIIVWDVMTGRPIREPLMGSENLPVRSIDWHPEGNLIVSVGDDRRIVLWDTRSGEILSELATVHDAPITAVAFNHSGTQLASAARDSDIYLWDITTETPIPMLLSGHANRVNDIAFSPDDRFLVSASDDQTLILWDTITGLPLGLPFAGHKYGVLSVDFAPDGTRFVSTGDGADTIKIWQADIEAWRTTACRMANRGLTLEEWSRFINFGAYVAGCG